jgi:histidine phosphotransferase ChpT
MFPVRTAIDTNTTTGHGRPQMSIKMSEMLISKMSHDIASPAGATQNGLELLEEEVGDMAKEALALVKQGALAVSTRLKVCRLAYGTAGGSKAMNSAQIQHLIQDMIGMGGRVQCVFTQMPETLSEYAKKMLFNMILCGIDSLPSGGQVVISATPHRMHIEMITSNPNRPANLDACIIWNDKTVEPEDLNPYIVQAWYTGFYAYQQGMLLEKQATQGGGMVLSVRLPSV